MFSGKKISISLLATLVAVPNLAFGVPTKVTKTTTTTKTTTSASKGSGGVITAEDKKDLELIGIGFGVGGVATLVARYKLYNWYKAKGGPQDMETFFNQADLKAKELIQDQDAMNKKTSKLNYKPLDEATKDSITEKAFEGYFVDKSAQLFGLEPNEFQRWFDSVAPGASLSVKADAADLVIKQLTLNDNSLIPGAKAGELPFQSAVRYAVKANVVTRLEASARIEKFATRSMPDTSGSTASRIGRAARVVVDAAGEAASDAARGIANAGRSIASGVGEVPNYVSQAKKAYVNADQSGNLYSEMRGASASASARSQDLLASAPQVSMQRVQQLRAGMASEQAAQAADADMANKYAEAGQATADKAFDSDGNPTVDTPEVF